MPRRICASLSRQKPWPAAAKFQRQIVVLNSASSTTSRS